MLSKTPIHGSRVSVFIIPTDSPEADGTFEWNQTTLVLVELDAGNATGLGYTYADEATAHLAKQLVHEIVEGQDASATPAIVRALWRRVRNVGSTGIAAMAISAIDIALWDLKAKLLDLPLATVLGLYRDAVPVYGSGGFTSYSNAQLEKQFSRWAEFGIRQFKMKVGTAPAHDPERVRFARKVVGEGAKLFVDANGAYTRKQALKLAQVFSDSGVTWFEEPVTADDLEGLRLARDRAPDGMEIAAGEYGYRIYYFERMLAAGAVDVLQVDATRCGGISGVVAAASVAAAHHVPLSAHCAPWVHLHLGCSLFSMRHIEFFHDHERIERMFFDGFREPVEGALHADLSRPGLGLELKQADANRYAA